MQRPAQELKLAPHRRMSIAPLARWQHPFQRRQQQLVLPMRHRLQRQGSWTAALRRVRVVLLMRRTRARRGGRCCWCWAAGSMASLGRACRGCCGTTCTASSRCRWRCSAAAGVLPQEERPLARRRPTPTCVPLLRRWHLRSCRLR